MARSAKVFLDINEMNRLAASLGGYLNRKSDSKLELTPCD